MAKVGIRLPFIQMPLIITIFIPMLIVFLLYTLHDYIGKQLRVLQDNATLKQRMQEYGFSEKNCLQYLSKEEFS